MPSTATRERTVICRLNPEPVQVGRARELVRKTLPFWGLGDHADLAELIVSELVTNALIYGEGQIEVRISYACGDLRAEVHDDGGGWPVRRQATAEDERGRGLELLDGLIGLNGGARGVVADSAGPGKTVYVAVSLPDPAGAL